jgi:hypothetical protein
MAGLVPAIHVFVAAYKKKTWMPGTGPGMTKNNFLRPRCVVNTGRLYCFR